MSEDLKKEEVFDDKLYHEHPLILRKAAGSEEYEQCSGCWKYIFSEETAYRCRQNNCDVSPAVVHEECAEMPREMKLSLHPQHTLIQRRRNTYRDSCAVCDSRMSRIGYYCSDDCDFQIHVGCAQNTAVMHAAAGGDRSCIDHPSHPQHRLTLLWRPGRSASLRCDACATIHKGSSYLCIECQYCINESCAALPATATYPIHDHPLSLAYHLPPEYIKFRFWCDICYKDFLPKYWLYHCPDCRYAVHINCALQPPPTTTIKIDGDAVVGFPMERNKAVEKLIVPFVMNKLGGTLGIPKQGKDEKYKFHKHDHELSLIFSSSLDEKEKEINSDDDDDDLNGIRSELVCDGCTLPIIHASSSSSSSYCNTNYYMSCSECKYFLHWACFHLPPVLPSHPLHLGESDHSLTLEATPKLDMAYCDACRKNTNGLFYCCKVCDFKVDILCASLPGAITHAAHPQHQLKLLTGVITYDDSYWYRLCRACNRDTAYDVCYRCEICGIILHASCVLLPAEVRNRTWDKHRLLPLTFDASRNHPSAFYCDVCETEMNPKRWMYHCRRCDFSFHPSCFPSASGEYQNIMFGHRYAVADEIHHHTLVYQLLTTKLRCDVCKKRKDYGSRGFQCHSHKCDFFMCLFPCGRTRQHLINPLKN